MAIIPFSAHTAVIPIFRISDKYFSTTNNRIGGKYKKARFHQYSDSSYNTKSPLPHPDRHLGLLGPVIRAEVGDTIDVTLYNKLTHPVSLYLQGVSLDKSQDGLWVKSPEGKIPVRTFVASIGATRLIFKPAPHTPSVSLFFFVLFLVCSEHENRQNK